MVLYQSTTETPHILPLLPTVATYQMLIHQTDEPVVQCSDAKIHSKFHRKMYLYEARCVSRSSPLSSCNNFFLNCHSQLMMVMTVMIHIVYPASASNFNPLCLCIIWNLRYYNCSWVVTLTINLMLYGILIQMRTWNL